MDRGMMTLRRWPPRWLLLWATVLLAMARSRAQMPTASLAKLEFDVVAVHPNHSGVPGEGGDPEFANIPMGPEETFRDTGGTFTARNTALIKYISFAYQVTTAQREVFRASMPDWVMHERFNIEARTDDHQVTKQQMRLMMRSLLAERFKLTVHKETRQVAVYAAVLAKPGMLGPHLRKHPEDEACSTIAPPLGKPDPDAAPAASRMVAGGYPMTCGGFARMEPTEPWLRHEGARDMPMATTVSAFSGLGNLGRPVIDQTGLQGNYDWVMEFLLESPPGTEIERPPEATGPKFTDALKNQLGLKLESQKASVEFVLVDHVERPSEN